MNVNNSLTGMLAAQMQINQNAQNIADVASVIGSPELQEVSQELIDSIVGQIPQVIAYEANANGIKTQDAVMESLLNIKA